MSYSREELVRRIKTGSMVQFDSTDVAQIMGWNTQRARRWLLRTGAGEKRAGRVVTTLGKIQKHWPEIFSSAAGMAWGQREL